MNKMNKVKQQKTTPVKKQKTTPVKKQKTKTQTTQDNRDIAIEYIESILNDDKKFKAFFKDIERMVMNNNNK